MGRLSSAMRATISPAPLNSSTSNDLVPEEREDKRRREGIYRAEKLGSGSWGEGCYLHNKKIRFGETIITGHILT